MQLASVRLDPGLFSQRSRLGGAAALLLREGDSSDCYAAPTALRRSISASISAC